MATQIRAFIVGMSRSGTRWMSMCLNQHSDIAVFGETGFWGKHYIDQAVYTPEQAVSVLNGLLGVKCESFDSLPMKPGHVIKEIRDQIKETKESLSPRDLFDRICDGIARASRKTYLMEKTPHHINYVDRILQQYPDSKFLVHYRDPYEFMLSYKHQGDRKEEHARQSFHDLYHPFGCALVYRGYALSILRVKEQYPEQTLLIPLHRIREEPKAVLTEIQRFLGVKVVDTLVKPRANSSFPEGNRPRLQDDDVAWMQFLAGNQMRRLGFESERNIAWLSLMRSARSLPGWGWRSLRHLSSYQHASVAAYVNKWLR